MFNKRIEIALHKALSRARARIMTRNIWKKAQPCMTSKNRRREKILKMTLDLHSSGEERIIIRSTKLGLSFEAPDVLMRENKLQKKPLCEPGCYRPFRYYFGDRICDDCRRIQAKNRAKWFIARNFFTKKQKDRLDQMAQEK